MVSSQSLSLGMKYRLHLNAMSFISVLLFLLFFFAVFASAQSSPQYGSMTACNGMTVGSPAYGNYGGALNNFVPFPSTHAWNTNIANAALDPNSAALMTKVGSATAIHPNFGQSPADGGIPYIVVDSTETPSVIINTVLYGGQSDVVVAPYPGADTVPIEDDETDCSGWPDTDIQDAHTLVLDRNTCWLYETWNTNRCNGVFDADSETIWDMIDYNARPWGWTSADAAGLTVFAGLVKYSEAASGTVSHAIRFTMEPTLGNANGGYFVIPAAHAASSTTTANLLPEGARLRLKSSVNISGFSAINQAILTGLMNYGMILADNGGNFYVIGDTDPNWTDSDLGNLKTITASDFDVIQMAPEYKGMDEVSAPTDYPETVPTVSSFSASETTVNAGTPVTFTYTVDGTNYNANYSAETGLPYAYIDNIGPQRLSGPCPCSGSVTITPTATQTYTLYATNSEGRAQSSSILITVTGSTLAPPVFIPSPGSYADNLILPVTMITQSSAETSQGITNATFYYTTDGTTPTTASTQYYGTYYGGEAINMPAAATTTLKAIVSVPGYSGTSAVTSGTYTIGSGSTELTDTPVLTPPPGNYNTIQTVYFQDATDDGSNGNTVYYTITAGTSGTAPVAPAIQSGVPPTPPTLAFNNDNNCYACPPAAVINVATTSTIEAVAEGVYTTTLSAVATGTYTLVTGTPAFSPAAGSYSGSQTVTISSVTPSATIYYTTNGTTPTTSSTVYSGPIAVSTSETVEALATYTGFNNSAVGSAAYTIGGSTTVATPTFSPAAGTYSSAQTVTISDSTSGATIYYTTNGTTPTTGSTVYSSAITVSATETVEALATHSGDTNSAAGSAAYTISSGTTVATPTFSPAAGTYTAAQSVTISDSTSGATIYYTTNGTTPTTSSSVYSSAITVSASETLEALATHSGDTNSAVGSAAYTINLPVVATPTFSPAAGTYSSAQTVTISDSTSGATIYYTTNGTTPTTSSSVYSSAITVSATETLKAIATHSGDTNSAVGSAAYTISSSSGPPSYVQECNITSWGTSISCTLPSAVTAGDTLVITSFNSGAAATTPTVTAGSTQETATLAIADNSTAGGYDEYLSVYYVPNALAGSTTVTFTTPAESVWMDVKEYTNVAAAPLDGTAYATGSGYSTTGIATANFSTTTASDLIFAVSYSLGGTETIGTSTEQPAGTTAVSWTLMTSGDSSIYEEYGSAGAAGTYAGYFDSTGLSNPSEIIAIALKPSSSLTAAATPTFSPAAGTYSSAQTVTISDSTSGATIYYTTNGTTPTTSSTVYSSAITVSATETLEAIATHSGDTNSAVGSAAYTINLTVATPTFSPAAGTYSSAQTVTISDSTSGSTIYYTTNGTTPTTSSSVYSSAITVSATETLEAIATHSGETNSAVGSAVYTINLTVATPTFSPAAGTYSLAQTVTISDSTSGSTIYYTTNGTTPTTSSTVYSSAIMVSATETLEAIATHSGETNSAVGSAAYTISSGTSSPAYVQQCNIVNWGTSEACTLSGVGAGHTLVIGVAGSSSQTGTVSSSTGTPTLVLKDGYELSAYILPNTTAGSYTITVTVSSGTSIELSVVEYSNTAASPLDGSTYVADGAWSSPTINSPDFTTTTAYDLLWSFCAVPSGTAVTAGTAPITWTGRTSPQGGEATLVEDGPTTTAGSYYGQCTSGAGGWDIITLALKP